MASMLHSRCEHGMTHHSLWALHPCNLLASVYSTALGCLFHTIHCAECSDEIKHDQCWSVGDSYTGTYSSRCIDTQGPFNCYKLGVLGHRP